VNRVKESQNRVRLIFDVKKRKEKGECRLRKSTKDLGSIKSRWSRYLQSGAPTPQRLEGRKKKDPKKGEDLERTSSKKETPGMEK